MKVLKSLVPCALALGLLAAAPPALAANTLIVGTLVSDPPEAQVGVRVEKGRKGLRVRMRWVNEFGVDQPGGFPIDISASAVTLTVNGVPQACSRNQISPAVGTCGYVSSPFGATGPVDTLRVFLNGDFAASAAVTVAVSGVKAFDASAQDPTNNTVSFTAGNLPSRTAASLEMVVDISGSMGLPAVPGGGTTRLDAVKQAAGAFFNLLSGHALLGDRVGAVFFSSTASGGTLQAAHDPAKVATMSGDVLAQVPTAATSIGAGLQQANGGAGLGGDLNPRKFVLLFSDGEENTDPKVDVVAGALQVGGVAYPAAIRVCPITAGRQSAPGFAEQQQIAAASCGGNNLHVRDSDQTFVQADFDTFFVQAVSDALIGDKLEIVKDTGGSVAPGTPRVEHFPGNSKDTAQSVLLSWSGPKTSDGRLRMRLFAPDGTEVETDGFTRTAASMLLTTLHFPLRQGAAVIDPRGDWRVEIENPSGPNQPALDYHLVVIADNETIASEARLDVSDPGTGEPIAVRVTVSEGGVPVTGATAVAELVGPQNGLGDEFARAAKPAGSPTGPDVVGSVAKGKLQLLLADPAFAARLRDQAQPSVVLSHTGGGVYTGSFAGASKEGHYQFQVKLKGTSASNGDYERSRRLSVFVRPKPDAARTDLLLLSSVLQGDGSRIVTLRATPRDRFSRLLGPDYPPQLAITSSLGSVATPLEDRLDGSYDVAYRLPSATDDPQIQLVILGQTVVDRPLSTLPGSSGGSGQTWAGSVHLGLAVPHGLLGQAFKTSFSVGADLEYRLTPHVSLEAYLAHDRFAAKLSGGDAAAFTSLSQRVRVLGGSGSVRPFAVAGLGVYADQDDDWHFGLSAGAGVQAELQPNLFGEGRYTFHDVHVSGGHARYSTLLFGLRFGF